MNVKMSRKWLLSLSITLGTLILLWVISTALAEGPEGGVRSQGDVSAAATVNSRLGYQGVLKENGQPVTGSRDMIFRFYSDDACTTQVGLDIPQPGVPVTDGLFSIKLDVYQPACDGRGLWLEVEVEGTQIGCEEVLPVPYALSLRPGAVIEGEPGQSQGSVLSVNMSGFYPLGKAVWASTATGSAVRGNSTSGYGLYGYSEQGYAVYGEDAGTETARGYGGYFSSANGVGVYGYSGAQYYTTNKYAPGVYGRSENGVGVYGVSESSSSSMAGVYGQASTGSAVRGESDDGTGLYGYSANNYAIRGVSGSSWGGYFTSYRGIGIRVNSDSNNIWDHAGYFTADWGYGIYALSDENQAVRGEAGDLSAGRSMPGGPWGVVGIGESGGTWGSSWDNYGVYGTSHNYRGVHGNTDRIDRNYGLYTHDNLYSLNYHLAGAVMHVVQNGDNEALEPGDVVVFSGISVPREAVGVPVVQVAKAQSANSTAVAGVVYQRFNIEALAEDAEADLEVTSAGPVEPGEYLLLVVQGPAQVKASALTGTIRPGDLLSSAGQQGHAAEAAEVRIEGVKTAVPGTVFGKALEPLDAGQEGLIYVFVTLQ